MKKLILTFGIILAGLFTATAQDASVDKQTAKIMDEYTSTAQITPDQAAKIKPMIEAFFTTKKENKEKYADDAVTLRTANKENRENLKRQLKTVLTPDQMQKIEDYNKEKKQAASEKNSNQQ